MKYLNFILALVFYVSSVNAQMNQEVISTAGGYSVNGDISISWTLGETIIPTFQNGDLVLTHGFQQQLLVTAIEEIPGTLGIVKVFPNPSSSIVNIEFESPVEGKKIDVVVVNSEGKVVVQNVIKPDMVNLEIDMQHLSAGIYFIKLIKGINSNIYKVVKVD